MGLIDRMREGVRAFRAAGAVAVLDGELADDAVRAVELRRDAVSHDLALQQRKTEAMMGTGIGIGMSLDQDDYQYRRLTGGGARNQRRDLSPIQQDKMLEIAWYLWEQNPFAKRLITVMTDLILGEGVTIEAQDQRLQVQINQVWDHRINQFRTRIREFYTALALNGELILPVERNPFTGRPVFGFIDPWQVHHVEHAAGNVLLPTFVVLKPDNGIGEGRRLKIVTEDPATGLLDGEVVYYGINRLPNSTRGRSDLLALADWLDLYDQYMFSEVERLHLLSAFVWDYKIEGADEVAIQNKLKKLGTPKPGTVWGHNEKESLDAVTPNLQAADRSEVARMLRIHIAGSMGFPVTYFGDSESNRATIEGQNDISMKTPAARQKEFAHFMNTLVRFSLEGPMAANPALFRDVDQTWLVKMPEIAAKDIARVGSVLSTVVTGLDTALANRTMSRRVATTTTVALLKHLGIEADPQAIMDEADEDAAERQEIADQMQAALAATREDPLDPGGRKPPVAGDDDGDEDE